MLHVRKKKIKKNALLEKKERKEKGICNCHQLPQLGIHAFQAPAPKKKKKKKKKKDSQLRSSSDTLYNGKRNWKSKPISTV
jgi:hypothetical protein